VDNEDEDKDKFNPLNFHLPILAILGLLAFFCWITYVGVSTVARIDSREARLERMVEEIRTGDKRLRELVEKSIDRWESSLGKDRTIWCLRAQRLNPDWKCPKFDNRYPNPNSPD